MTAKNFKFTKPDKNALNVSEINSLSHFLDDSIETTGSRFVGKPLILTVGSDSAFWEHTYTEGGKAYEILTDDAEIALLRFHGHLSRSMQVNITLKLFKCDNKRPIIEREWNNQTWSAGDSSALTIKEDLDLEELEDDCIEKFRVEVKPLTSGSSFPKLQLTKIEFNLEADDIEKCKCD